jgi:spermidine/putrescine transport system permease protein
MAGLVGIVLTALLYSWVATFGAGLPETVALLLVAAGLFVFGARVLSAARILPQPGRYRVALMGPAFAFYAAFFLVPLGYLVAFSLAHQSGYDGITYGFSLDNFRGVLSTGTVEAFARTLRMAILGTFLVILIGFPLAYWLARYSSPQRRNALLALVIVPFWTSFLIRTMSFLIVFDPRSIFSQFLQNVGLTQGPLALLGTPTAVQIGIVYGYLPLFVLPAYAALERLDWRIQDAANDLGATPGRTMWQVTLPLAMPGLITGGLLVFIPMLGEYVIPQILGGGKVDLVGNLIQRRFLTDLNYPQGAALSMLLIAMLGTVITVMLWLSSRRSSTGAVGEGVVGL